MVYFMYLEKERKRKGCTQKVRVEYLLIGELVGYSFICSYVKRGSFTRRRLSIRVSWVITIYGKCVSFKIIRTSFLIASLRINSNFQHFIILYVFSSLYPASVCDCVRLPSIEQVHTNSKITLNKLFIISSINVTQKIIKHILSKKLLSITF